MHTNLLRFGSTPMGTFGKMELYNDVDKVLEAFTVEKPWNDNRPFDSCIPAGDYVLEKHDTPNYPRHFALVGGTVSHWKDENFARYACLFHTANRARDVQGCIGLGEMLGVIYKEWAVIHSGPTIDEFNDLLNAVEETHTVSIKWADLSAA